MQHAGFLGTAAPLAADVTLLLEMGMGWDCSPGRCWHVLDASATMLRAKRLSCFSIWS